ncbi:MAG: Ig-like domain-containing protein [Planctomycetota bacterium]
MRSLTLIVALAGIALGAADEPTAKISFPWDGALVRSNVPIFGVADSPKFRLFRLEFGEGRDPDKWHMLHVSTTPEPFDPWAAGKVEWDPDIGAYGNLYTWDTGLTSYWQWLQTKNLNGVYTLRLVVEDESGARAETQLVVTVARAVTKETGGIVDSRDKKVYLNVPKHAVPLAYMLASVQPVEERKNPLLLDVQKPAGLIRVSKYYEFRPPGVTFLKPVALRMYYDPARLKRVLPDGKTQHLPETKLSIYTYLPLERRWKPVPGARPDVKEDAVRAQLKSITRHIAYYAVMADIAPPEAPELRAAERRTERSAVTMSGTAEPFATVRVRRGGKDVATGRAGKGGTFTFERVPLERGKNVFRAVVEDDSGNTSAPSEPTPVVRWLRPPSVIHSVEIVGKPEAERGDTFAVKLAGKDSSLKTNRAFGWVRSRTDPKGFQLELVETGPRTGVYVGSFEVGDHSDAGRGVIAARSDGEDVTVFSTQNKTKRDTVTYRDTVAPPPPAVASPTHPSLRQDTFEGPAREPEHWRNIGGRLGAALSIQRDGGNGYLQLKKQVHNGHLGALAVESAYSTKDFPLISFDYRLYPDVHMDLQIHHRRWRLIELNDLPGRNKEFEGAILTRLPGVVADGRWHRAEVDLRSLLGPVEVGGVRFINWDKPAYLRLEFGDTGPRGATYGIDNFRILGYGGPDATFTWSADDENGVAGYGAVLDRESETEPPETVTAKGTTKTYKGLAEGRWYFHVRAVDKSGNWGRAHHYMILVDTKPPTATLLSKVPEDGRRSWDEPIRVRLDDGGASGINERSLRLTVNDKTYSTTSPAMTYDRERGVLAFAPPKTRPYPLLPSDGEEVSVELTRAEDRAGHPVDGAVRLSYVADSFFTVIPANPDGENGWYTRPPKVKADAGPGTTFTYRWAVEARHDPYFRRGNSINTLTITENRKGGTRNVYRKEFRLDCTVPTVRAHEVNRADGRVIVLEHDDYVLTPGRLRCRVYDNRERGGAPLSDVRTQGVRLPEISEAIRKRMRAVRWSGRLYVPRSDVYELVLSTQRGQRVELAVSGEKVLDTGKMSGARHEASRELVLKRTMLPVEIRWRAQDSGARPRIRLRWRRKRRLRNVPASVFFTPRSLATILYRWDAGKAQEYKGPIVVKPNNFTLTYWAIDEAGHKSKRKRLTIDRE